MKLWGQELNENSLRYFGETYEGIKRQSVLRPNNIMLIPQDIPNNRITPIQNAENEWEDRVSTHFDYQDLYTRLVNLDICENDGLTLLEALQELSNFPADHITFNDSKVLLLFNSVKFINFIIL